MNRLRMVSYYLVSLMMMFSLCAGAQSMPPDRRNPNHPPPPPDHGRPGILRMDHICRSSGYRFRQCPIPPGNQIIEVRLIQAMNRSDCRSPGYNWGFTNDAVWVDHGCQGYFEVFYRPFSHRDPRRWEKVEDVFCRSSGYRYRSCVPTRLTEIHHVEFLSAENNSDCREGNWGFERFYVWVDRGCQAVLRIYGR